MPTCYVPRTYAHACCCRSQHLVSSGFRRSEKTYLSVQIAHLKLIDGHHLGIIFYYIGPPNDRFPNISGMHKSIENVCSQFYHTCPCLEADSIQSARNPKTETQVGARLPLLLPATGFSKAFIATLLFDTSMSAFPIVAKQNSPSLGLFTH